MKHIHFSGVCGMGMGTLAVLLKQQGYHVTGSDANAVPPMSSYLQQHGIEIMVGYRADNFEPAPDLCIIGNVLHSDNVEGLHVVNHKLPAMSMAEAVRYFIIKDKHSIVVAGTHGKTTTTTMLAWILEYAEKQPGYFIGGILNNFQHSAHIGAGDIVVLEGDEYGTSFFDMGSKFLHYKADTVILTSVDRDHVEYFDGMDSTYATFSKLLDQLPDSGVCVACIDNPGVQKVLGTYAGQRVSYGFSSHADWAIQIIKEDAEGTHFKVEGQVNACVPLYGRHNISNLVACMIALQLKGIEPQIVVDAMHLFKGVERRQELKGVVNGIHVIDDFAHHPRAIQETIYAIRKHYPEGRLWAIFEPRSKSSCMNVFQQQFVQSFQLADEVVIAKPYHSDRLPLADQLNPQQLVQDITAQIAIHAEYIASADKIVEYVGSRAQPGDVLLIMSNGIFDHIHQKMLERLKRD